MLALRTKIGLTQVGLAKVLRISRRAVGDWEAGNAYPKPEHLKQLILLAIDHQAFPESAISEEVRALWQAAHQKLLLDEVWLNGLLPHTESPSPFHPLARPHVDWGDALAVPAFYGREWELSLLTEWVISEKCRVVSIIGLGGIGKSALSVTLMHQVAEHFDVVIWRSLRDLPDYDVLLDSILQVVAPHALGKVNETPERRQSFVLEYFRRSRVLLVLDNLESVLEEGEGSGRLRPGYEGIGRFLHLSAETEHKSCVVLTSREKPIDLIAQEGNRSRVRALRLARLDVKACEKLLLEKDVTGNTSIRAQLIEAYSGNPLALKIVAQTIVDLFDGEIALFLEQGEVIFGGVRELLGDQFERLSPLEQSVLLWLAILREPATLSQLLAALAKPVPRGHLLEAIEALRRRSLIERGQEHGSFTLQSVVLEYATAQLVADVSHEIQEGRPARLIEYGLELAQAHEYVRQTQERLIVHPLLARLRSSNLQQVELEKHLLTLLVGCKVLGDHEQGYGPANLVTLLRLQRGNLSGLDLSRLVLRGLYLQDVEMQDSMLFEALFQESVFTETFDAMTAVAISRTGDYWAAASRRGEIRIWKAGGNALHQAWRGHVDMIWALAFSPDERTLATGSWDGMVKVWNVSNASLLWSGRHTSFINRVAISPDSTMLASAGNDGTVLLWDLRSGTLLQTFVHSTSVEVVTWSPDGFFLVSGDVDGCIRLWSIDQTESAKETQMFLGHTNNVTGLAFSPDGRTLASGAWDGTVKLWEISNGRVLQTLTGHTDRVGSVVWSPDGRTLASGSSDQTILLWDVDQVRYRAMLKGHSEGVYELAFTPNSRKLLSSSRDGTLRVWDTTGGQCIRVIYGYAASFYDIDWSPDGTQLVSGGTDLLVTTWDVASGRPLHGRSGHYGVVCTVGWNPRGRWLASSESEHAIRLWDLASEGSFQFLQDLDDSGKYMYSLAWSPDGQRLASGTNRGGITFWDVISNTQNTIGQQLTARFPHIAWSSNSKQLAGGGDDGIVYVWNVTEGSLEQRFVGHHSLIKCLAWSPDGLRLASGSTGMEGGQLFVWDIGRAERLTLFKEDSGIVSAIVWGTSEDMLVSGSGDGLLRWWSIQNGECVRVRQAHLGTIQSLRRSPDGTKIASCGDDGAIMLWDLASGAYLQTLRRDRPFERLNITGIRGLSDAQKATLRALGAIEERGN